jgi:outer membrane receptor protein involved in Fe transport
MLIGAGKMQYKHHNILTWMLVCIFLPPLQTFTTLAADVDKTSAKDLTDLSLNELMDIKIYVPATITEKNPMKVPASVTVITAEDIALTPARNILDLIEIYVPGALWMNHSVGPLPGIRGNLVDRPYKFLVNVNGVNVNIKAHYGARLELLNWELNDIERIEIIRGPGSVTYGPGAIGAVINIYTKTGREAPGLQAGGRFWDKYNSVGEYLSYGHDSNKANVYSYLSVVNTQGHTPDLFGVSSSTSGYMGHPGGPSAPYPPADYFADYDNEPQIKAHVDARLNDNLRFWTRYTTESTDLMQGTAQKYLIDGEYENFRQTRYRNFMTVLEKQTTLNAVFDSTSLLSFRTTDVHNVEKHFTDDRDDIRNCKWIWSENEYFARFMFNYEPEDSIISAAFGFEGSYDTIGPAWGKNKDNGLRLSEAIISGPSSEAYGTDTDNGQVNKSTANYFAVGNGWETWSHAFLGELNIALTPKTTTIFSARFDKHSYTDYMFSPRFAWIYELGKDSFLKFIAQRSVRMNTQEELYINHELGLENKPEILDTLELIYTGKATENLSYQVSTFYNRDEVIAWDATLRRTDLVGTLETFGVEAEAKYQKENYNIGINHSFVKQLDWKLAENVTASGISYSDYYYKVGSVIINSKGNNLSNWANNATKLFTNIDFLDGRMTLHGDARIFWGFEGLQDGLDALSEAGIPAVAAAEIEDAERHHAYGPQATGGVSLMYRFDRFADVTFFVQGIPLYGDNKRYSYSSGFRKNYPDKTSWIEEPIVIGFSYRVRF